MPRLEKILLIILILIAFFLWLNVGINFYQTTWQVPLGPGIELEPIATSSAQFISKNPNFENPAVGSRSQPTNSQAQNSSPLCNGPRSLSLLAIGSDTRAQGYLYGLADVIRYIRFDFITPRITVLEFPRDLWVEIPDIADHYDITHGKLNQAYFYGNPGMNYYPGPGQGPGLLARTLSYNFGAQPDHYIAVNMQTFVRFIDTIGGIDINLPYSVDARKPDQQKRQDLFFEPGLHHLNGQETLMLGRIREYSVYSRADQQNRILCAIRDKLIQPSILPKIPEIISNFSDSIQTDLSPEQISQLACLAPYLNSTNITFTTFPRHLLTESRTFDIGVQKDVFVFLADFQTLKMYVQAFDLGAWPELETNTSKETGQKTPQPRGEGQFSCP